MLTSEEDSYQYRSTRDTDLLEVGRMLRHTSTPVVTLELTRGNGAIYKGNMLDLGRLPDLDILEIQGPGLITGPFSYLMPSLTVVDVKDQRITTIQEFLDNAPTTLSVLILSGNLIEQACFNKEYDLEYIDLSNNRLNYICGLEEQRDLDILYLQGNKLQNIDIPLRIGTVDMSDNLVQEVKNTRILLPYTGVTMDEVLLTNDDLQGSTSLVLSGGYGDLSLQMVKVCPGLVNLSVLFGHFDGSMPRVDYFQQLTSLHISSRYLSDASALIDSLPRLAHLDVLNLSDNIMQEFHIPEDHYSIRELNLARNVLENVTGLEYLDYLVTVNLASNRLQTVPEGLSRVNVDMSDNPLLGPLYVDIYGVTWNLGQTDVIVYASDGSTGSIILGTDEIDASDLVG